MSIVAPILTLLLGFFAAWITIKPPGGRSARVAWIAVFAFLSLIAVIGTSVEKRRTTELLDATKKDAQDLHARNADLRAQVSELKSGVAQGIVNAPPPTGVQAGCLKSDVQAELEQIKAFLKDRSAKDPRSDPRSSNDPQLSQKVEAYAKETSRQYIQRFWPSVQKLLQRAVAESVTPEDTEILARPIVSPDQDYWLQMGFNPGYKELVKIAQQAKC